MAPSPLTAGVAPRRAMTAAVTANSPSAFSSGDLRIKDIALDNLLNRRLGLPTEVTGQGFRRVQLTDRYYSEGITAGDFNHDGVMDVVAGPYYYPGPSFQTAVEIYPPRTYSIRAADQAGGYTTPSSSTPMTSTTTAGPISSKSTTVAPTRSPASISTSIPKPTPATGTSTKSLTPTIPKPPPLATSMVTASPSSS